MPYPLIALWVHPRSMSSATERIMIERGDCRVFHEPFMAAYYLHRPVREMPLLEKDKFEHTTYQEMRDSLMAAAEEQAVFFKDMSYYVQPEIFSDPDFAKRTCNIFLIRDPRLAIASYYKLDPDLTLTEIGLEAQWNHYRFLREELDETPLVLEAESVAKNPQGEIAKLCQIAGLPLIEEAFRWSAGALPNEWKHVEGWHQDVANSTGIKEDKRDPEAVFSEATQNAPELKAALAHHWGFYMKLKAAAQA